MYGNPWFSVQAVACTEIISFPYTPSDRHPTGQNRPELTYFGSPSVLNFQHSLLYWHANPTGNCDTVKLVGRTC